MYMCVCVCVCVFTHSPPLLAECDTRSIFGSISSNPEFSALRLVVISRLKSLVCLNIYI